MTGITYKRASLHRAKPKDVTFTMGPGDWLVTLTYSVPVSHLLGNIAEWYCQEPYIGGVLRRRYRATVFGMELNAPLSADLFAEIFDDCAIHESKHGCAAELALPLDYINFDWVLDHLRTTHCIPHWAHTMAKVLYEETKHNRHTQSFGHTLVSTTGLPCAHGIMGMGMVNGTWMDADLHVQDRLIPERIELGYPTEHGGFHSCLSRRLCK